MTTEIDKHWYDRLIDDCKTIIIEKGFESRWALVEGYHALGARILEDNDNFERTKIYGEHISHRVAESLGVSERTINYAVKFAQAYPDVGMLPGGKNISWQKVCREYLTAKKDDKEARQERVSLPPPSSLPALSGLLQYKSYVDYVKAQPCILCGIAPVDPAHFPKTRGAGAPDDWVIPLCREDHAIYHQDPVKWTRLYQDFWAAWFYGLIPLIWGKEN